MAWPAAIGAAIGGITSAFGASRQQKSSQAMAREQMRFQERMSNTAYQRAAKDLESAGLNRVLALGSPASSPGGAMGTAQNVLGQGVTSAMQAAQATAGVKLTSAQARKTQNEADILQPKADVSKGVSTVTSNVPGWAEKAWKGLTNLASRIIKNQTSGSGTSAKERFQHALKGNTWENFMSGDPVKPAPDVNWLVMETLKKMDLPDMTDEELVEWAAKNPEKVKRAMERMGNQR